MLSPVPIPPEEGLIPNDQWMQEDTHLSRLFGDAALPLALCAQWAGTATVNARARNEIAGLPSASRRCSCAGSDRPDGHKSVPSAWRGKSAPVKRPVFQEVAVVGEA
jgi:hypothetical protein